jgi:hypothetical protein
LTVGVDHGGIVGKVRHRRDRHPSATT